MKYHQADTPKPSILIVDDTVDNVRLLSTMLSEQGYIIRKAINGQMALKSVHTTPPDLILLDINMPDMNGYEVCKHLKADRQTYNIPVIFISALNEAIDKVKAFNVGGVDYITKPFQLEEVSVRVKNHLTIQEQQKQLAEQNALLQLELRKCQQVEEKLQQANLELQRIANVDGLTQVANRRRFDGYLSQEWQRMAREKLPLSLILSDVDYFKLYNDTYGHQAGDDCLKQVAQAISHALKRPADLVARYGGEEFAVILPNTASEGAVCVAKAIRLEVQRLKIAHAQSKVSDIITLSFGVASTIPTNEFSADALICVADEALYQAKKEGRDMLKLLMLSSPSSPSSPSLPTR